MDFRELQVDPIEGTEIMSLIGADVTQLSNPGKFNKIREIINYFQGKQDKQYVISKLTLGKNVDKINFLFEYIGLRKQYEAKMNEMASLKSPDELINSVPDEKDREQLKSILGTSNLADIKTRELAQLQEQLALYEN
jgi:hypothetical protein